MISIIIVNYNSGEYLAKCVASIKNTIEAKDHEIIIIDNKSTDQSLDLAEKNNPNISILINKKNVGFSKANNAGIKKSRGDYLLFLNPDTELKDGAIYALLKFMQENSDAGACGPKVLNSDGTVQNQCKRGFPDPLSSFYYFSGISRVFPKSRVFGHYLMTCLDDNAVNEVDALSGACMLVKADFIKSIGGFDEAYFLYGEDLDLCYRIKEQGRRICYIPKAEIVHYGGVGSRTMSTQSIKQFYHSMFLFYDKHYKNKYPAFVRWLVYFGIQIKYIQNIMINAIRKEKYAGSKKP